MSRVLSKQQSPTKTGVQAFDAHDPVELSVSELMEKGKTRGYLTWEELNDALPDEAVLPDRLEAILHKVEDLGIDMIDEAEAQKLSFGEDQSAKKKTVNPMAADAPEDDFPVEAPSRRIDDPVRMYLTQMGEIPLLTRAEEIALAKKIELTRMAFRRMVLESDCSLGAAADLLQGVNEGTLPFDRTMKIASGENQAKQTVLTRLPFNLASARKLMDLNQESWVALENVRDDAERDAIWRQINSRRRKAVRLFEELALRTSKVTPLMRKLFALCDKMTELQKLLGNARRVAAMPVDEAEAMRDELAGLQDLVLETPEMLRDRVQRIRKVYVEYEDAKRKLSGGNLRLVVSIAKKYRNRGLSVPRHHSGRQHRPDAGGRQVRVPPRVQVQHVCDVVDSPGDHPRDRRPGPDDSHSGPHDRDDEQAAEHFEEVAARRWAARRRSKRSRSAPRCRSANPPRHEDQPSPDFARPAGRRERGFSYFGDFIEDGTAENPVSTASNEMLKDRIEQVLKSLTYREREIIKLRYGIGDGYTYTLEEVGKIFKVTRERVRQVEAKAIRKLQHPVRARKLEGFLDKDGNLQIPEEF